MHSWDEKPELNITPLVDIMLVLLAIMMVVAPTIIYEERVSLPHGSAQKTVVQHHPIEIIIDKNRVITIGQERFEYRTFPDTFRLFASKYPRETIVMIMGDKSLRYDDVMWILKSVKSAGFTQVSLATNG